MKNLLKFLGLVLVAACFLISCEIEKGGTIEVTNKTGYPNYFIIVEGSDFAGAVSDLTSGKGTLINNDETKKVYFDNVGIYTVIAANPAGFHKTVTLVLGKTERVTLE